MPAGAPTPDWTAEEFADALPFGVGILAADGTVTWASQRAATLVGHPRHSLVGRNLAELVVPEDLDKAVAALDHGSTPGGGIMGPVVLHCRDVQGRIRTIEGWSISHLDDPSIGGFVVVLTEQRAVEHVHAATASVASGEPAAETLRHLVHAMAGHPLSATGFIVHRHDGAADVIAPSPLTAALTDPEQQPALLAAVQTAALRDHADTSLRDDPLAQLADSAGFAAVWVRTVTSADDEPAVVMVVCRDAPGAPSPNQEEHLARLVSTASLALEKERLHTRLVFAATHDPLTGVANRVALFDALTEHASSPTTLLLLDLDDFKETNDSLGHHLGDEIVVEVARRVRAAAPPEAVVARTGGDEFAVLIPGGDDLASGIRLAETVLQEIAQPLVIRTIPVAVEATLGLALDDGGRAPEKLFEAVDAALYEAKRSARGRWRLAG